MAVLLLAFADQALANWWIVRDASDEKCLVVDLEPTGNDKTVTKVGEVYQTPQQAEADVKRLCKESKAEDRPARDPGNAESDCLIANDRDEITSIFRSLAVTRPASSR